MRRRESYLYLMDQAECSARLAQCLQEMTITSSTNIAWPNQLLTTVCSSLAVNLAHQCVLDAQPCHSSWAARHQAQLTAWPITSGNSNAVTTPPLAQVRPNSLPLPPRPLPLLGICWEWPAQTGLCDRRFRLALGQASVLLVSHTLRWPPKQP